MTDEAESERKARAERLRKRIGTLTGQEPDEVDKAAPKPESAADFVHRRMRELDRKTDENKDENKDEDMDRERK